MKRDRNDRKTKLPISWRQRCALCALPCAVGVLMFSVIPFLRVIYYSFIKSQFIREFVGLDNYISVLKNEYFRLAMKNSFILVLHGVVPLVVIATFLALIFMEEAIKKGKFPLFYVIPAAVPTAAVVSIWRKFFFWCDNCAAIDVLFIWKNLGLAMILVLVVLVSIPKEIFEAAKLDGADKKNIAFRVSLPIASPMISFVFLMGIMNSYKIFKESYLYYGTNYPPDYMYTLQFYMNNNFAKLNYQSLAVSAIYTMILCVLFVLIAAVFIRRYNY